MKLITTLGTIMLLGAISPAYSQVAFSEDFEGVTTPALPGTFSQNTTSTKTGWKTHTGTLAFTNLDWAVPAHTVYTVVDDWNSDPDANTLTSLITPYIDLTTLTRPYLAFEYYFIGAGYNGGARETCIVEITKDSGVTWVPIDTLAGEAEKWQRSHTNLSAYIGEPAVMFAFRYRDGGAKLIGAAIDNIKVFDPPSQDVELSDVTPMAGESASYKLSNANVTLSGNIFNNGSDAITSYTIHYQQGTNNVVSDIITGVNIAPFTSAAFTATTPYTMPTTVGNYPINMWIELTGDNNAMNDSGKTTLTAVSFMPKKKILAEEGTGTWCGWCPRGHVFMDSIAHSSTHADAFSLVAVHNNDPMVVAAYDSKLGDLIGGYPSMIIDRKDEVDPSELFTIYDEQKDNFGFADITLTDIPVSGFNFSVKASVKPAIDLAGDYRLAMVLTQDDVRGTGSGWGQANYYSSQSANQPLKGSGLDWQQEPSTVPAEKMHYNHVARTIQPSPDGAPGSLPTTMTAGTTYDYTFTTNIQPYWHRYNMHVIVMIIRNADGQVLNTNNILMPLGMKDVDAGISEFMIFPNPAVNTAYVNFYLAQTSNVNVVVTDMMGRTIQSINKQNFEAGKHRLNLDLTNTTNGIYNVSLQTDNGTISTRLSVVK